jgi:hypothetical protein
LTSDHTHHITVTTLIDFGRRHTVILKRLRLAVLCQSTLKKRHNELKRDAKFDAIVLNNFHMLLSINRCFFK